MKLNYPWKRKWKPVDSSDSSETTWIYPESENPIHTVDLPSRSQLLVLLGGLGMGKTTELKELAECIQTTGRRTSFVKASALGDSPSTAIKDLPGWEKHKEGEVFTLLIDGIDEVLPYRPDFLDALCLFLESNRSPDLNVILGMRNNAWERSVFDDLFEAWETKETLSVLQIRPLSQDDIRVVFAQNKASGCDEFLEWTHKMDAMPMAGSPLYIDEVIAMWCSEPAKRPSIHKLRDTQINRLLLETPERTGKTKTHTSLSQEKLKALAELVAVHSILAGRPKLIFGMTSETTADTLDLLSFLNSPINAEWKAEGNSFAFNESDLRALVQRPLFESSIRPDHPTAISFSHHSFAERLAGCCLFRQPVERVIRMLANPEQSRIVPQMQPITALLAPSDQALSEWLIRHQPKILLSSDATEFEPAQRARVVKAVLEEIEKSDENDRLSWTNVDTGYRGPEVVAEMLAVISNKSFNVLTRIAALVISERNPQDGIEEELWNRLNDPEEDSIIRKDALDAWIAHARLDVSKNHSRLWDVVRGGAGRGKAHDKADALRVLLKSGTPVRDIIAYVPSKDENLIGSLDMLVSYEIPPRISFEDLPACFEYMKDAELEPYEKIWKQSISKTVYLLAFKNLHDAETAQRLADHFWQLYRDHYRFIREEFGQHVKDLSAESRRALITALLNSKERPEKDRFWNLPVEKDDFEWIVKSYLRADPPERDTWKLMIQTFWRMGTEDGMPIFLNGVYEKGSVEFRGLFPIPRNGRSIEETISRYHMAVKRHGERNILQKNRRLARYNNLVSRLDFTNAITEQLQSDPISGWVNFANYAFEARSPDEEKEKGKLDEIIESLGWNGLSAEAKKSARVAAGRFLVEKTYEFKAGYWSNWLEAAYQAIDLLYDDIYADIEAWSSTIEKWKFAVLKRFNNAEERHQDLVKLLKLAAPEIVRAIMMQEVRNDLEETEYCMSIREFAKSWDSEDSVALSKLIGSLLCGSDRKRILLRREVMLPTKSYHDEKEEARKARAFTSALHFLVKNDSESARILLSGLCRTPIYFRNKPHPGLPLLLISGAFHFPELWPELWTAFYGHSLDTQRQVFDLLVAELDRDYFSNGWSSRLDADKISQLYILFDRVFPVMPNHSLRNGFVTVPMHRQEFEEVIRRRLTDFGASGTIEELIARIGCDNRREALKWCLQAARKRYDELRWNTPEPKEISKWIREGESIFVRNAHDLKEAILVSLHRFNDLIRTDTPVLRRCWDKQTNGCFAPIGEEDLSSEIGSHLATDLKQIVVTREEQLRVEFSNNRTDIVVRAIVDNNPIKVIVEHKRAHNKSSKDPVNKAMKSQLADRYLKASGSVHGIYLVSWFDGYEKLDSSIPVKNGLGVGSYSEALKNLQEQANVLNRDYGLSISTLVLNCSLSP